MKKDFPGLKNMKGDHSRETIICARQSYPLLIVLVLFRHLLALCIIHTFQIIVSSGGMLTQSLNVTDLQVENMRKFDGTVVYAQNKRQQIVMTEQYAKQFPNVHFSSMHPGWSDTPGTCLYGFSRK